MPIRQRDKKWYWGSQGPFPSRKKAEKVAQAAHASGYVSKLLDFTILSKAPPEGVEGISGIGDTSSDRPKDDVPKQFREYASLEEIKRLGLRPHTGVEEGTFYDSRELKAGQYAAATGEKHTVDELQEAGEKGAISLNDLGIKLEDTPFKEMADEEGWKHPEEQDLNNFLLNEREHEILDTLNSNPNVTSGKSRKWAYMIEQNKKPFYPYGELDSSKHKYAWDWLERAGDTEDEYAGGIRREFERVLGRGIGDRELMSDIAGELRQNAERLVRKAQEQLEDLDILRGDIKAFKIERGIDRIGLKRGEKEAERRREIEEYEDKSKGEKIVSASPENQERAKRFEEENKGLSEKEIYTFKSPLGAYLDETKPPNYGHTTGYTYTPDAIPNNVDVLQNVLQILAYENDEEGGSYIEADAAREDMRDIFEMAQDHVEETREKIKAWENMSGEEQEHLENHGNREDIDPELSEIDGLDHSFKFMDECLTTGNLQAFVDECQRMANHSTKDLPEVVTVYRGHGEDWDDSKEQGAEEPKPSHASPVTYAERRYAKHNVIPVSLSPSTAKTFATSHGTKKGTTHKLQIHRNDILIDTRKGAYPDEQELLISSDTWKRALEHPNYEGSSVDPKDGTHSEFFSEWDHRDKHRARMNPASPHYNDSYTKQQHSFQQIYLESLKDPNHKFHKLTGKYQHIKDTITDSAKLDIKESKKYPWLKAPPKTTKDKDDMGQEKSIDLFKSITVGMLMKDSPFEVSPTGVVKPLSRLLDFVILSKAPPFQVSPEGEVSPLKPIEGVTHFDLDVHGEEHSEASKIPEKDRRYFKPGIDKLPDEINYTYTGKLKGHFYDRNQLSDKNFDDEVTNLLEQFDTAWKEYEENERAVWKKSEVAYYAALRDLRGVSDVDEIEAQLRSDLNELYERRDAEDSEDEREGIDIKIAALRNEELAGLESYRSTSNILDSNERLQAVADKYLEARERSIAKVRESLDPITDKLGTALVTQIKRVGFTLDGEHIQVDSDLEYALGKDAQASLRSTMDERSPEWDMRIPAVRDDQGNVIQAGTPKKDEEIASQIDRMQNSLGGSYNHVTNKMTITPETWRHMSKTTPSMYGNHGQKSAYIFLSTFVHETLHSRGRITYNPYQADLGNTVMPEPNQIADFVERTANEQGWTQERMDQQFRVFLSDIMAKLTGVHIEYPMELTAGRINFLKYHSGKTLDPFEEEQALHSYGTACQMYARWALAIHGGDAAKAFAFTKRHREMAEQKAEEMSPADREQRRQKIASITVSYGTYLAQLGIANIGRTGDLPEEQQFVGGAGTKRITTYHEYAEHMIEQSLGFQTKERSNEIWEDAQGDPALNVNLLHDQDFLARQTAGLPDHMNLIKKYPPDHSFWRDVANRTHISKIISFKEEDVEKSIEIDSAISLFHDMLHKSVSIPDPVSELLDFIILSKAKSKPLSGISGISGIGGSGDTGLGDGAGEDKSPKEEDAESIPEENRVYIKEGESVPKDVRIHQGKRGGSFYDMTELTDAHEEPEEDTENDEQYNEWLDEYDKLQTDEGTQYQEQLQATLRKKLDDLRGEIERGINITGESGGAFNVEDEMSRTINTRNDLINEGAELDDPRIVEAQANLASMAEHQSNETDKILDEHEEYQSLLKKWAGAGVDTKMRTLRGKIGTTLVDSITKNGYQVDGMKLEVDPDLTYDESSHGYDRAVAKSVENWLKDLSPSMNPSAIQKIVDLVKLDALPDDPKLGPVRDFVETERRGLHGAYTDQTNTFVMSPRIFDQLSKARSGDTGSIEQKQAMLDVMGTLVHESLHSHNAKARSEHQAEYFKKRGKGLDYDALMKKHNLSSKHEVKVLMGDMAQHLHNFFEEAPTELLAKSIVGRKYNSDLVGQNPYGHYHGETDDDTFMEGAGSQEQHKWGGYPDMLPHVGRWALGLSGGDPVKARALLVEMRGLGAGKGITRGLDVNTPEGREHAQKLKANHDRMDELALSYGTYAQNYAKKNEGRTTEDGKPIPLKYIKKAALVAEGITGKASQSPILIPTMQGWGVKSSELILPGERPRGRPIWDAGPTHETGDNSSTEDAHLDLMHLVYGTKPIEYRVGE